MFHIPSANGQAAGGECVIEGFECKCGFKSMAKGPECPRCGRIMSPRKFFDEGKILSFVQLNVKVGHRDKPMNMVMVEIDNGPKLICWAEGKLSAEQRVRVFSEDGLLLCRTP